MQVTQETEGSSEVMKIHFQSAFIAEIFSHSISFNIIEEFLKKFAIWKFCIV